MYFSLKRVAENEHGTFGVLLKEGITPVMLTLEDKWKNNNPNISCIPTGTYQCKRIVSPKFGDVFEILNVPNRGHILFHTGNVEDDTHGCILLGSGFGQLNGKTSLEESKKAFNEFMGYLNNLDHFLLIIIDKR